MATTVDSLLDIYLDQFPALIEEEYSKEELYEALDQAYNAIQILTNEVERIRIATGTAPPP